MPALIASVRDDPSRCKIYSAACRHVLSITRQGWRIAQIEVEQDAARAARRCLNTSAVPAWETVLTK